MSNSYLLQFRKNPRTIDTIQGANSAYNEFINKCHTECERAFPLRTLHKNRKLIKREPWLTKIL